MVSGCDYLADGTGASGSRSSCDDDGKNRDDTSERNELWEEYANRKCQDDGTQCTNISVCMCVGVASETPS